MKIKDLTIKKFNEGLINKDFTAVEAALETFKDIEERDGDINSYIRVIKDKAIIDAEKTDLALAKGENIGILSGALLAIKDNILIKGTITTGGSKILEKYKASYNATVINKLSDAGTVFLGKTNLDEFAMGSSTENSGFKITKNPLDITRVPGGSSGGSAASVAAGLALASLGSDTGGSIRQPAAFCGLVGLKTSYGAVSRHGLMAMASSLDQIGPITKTVEDAAIIFNTIKGKDKYDATTTDIDFSLNSVDLEKLKGKTIGIPEEYFPEGLNNEIKEGIEKARKTFENLGIKIKTIKLPHTEHALAVYYIIMPAEVSTNLARYDGIRYSRVVDDFKDLDELYLKQKTLGYGKEAKRRILLGTFVLSSGYYDAYYSKAQKVRRLIQQDFNTAFNDVDVILTPTTPTTAFKIGEKTNDPLEMYLSDIFTVPANLAGLPAISIPVTDYKTKDNLPVGFQLIGKFKGEQDIMDLGMLYERETGVNS